MALWMRMPLGPVFGSDCGVSITVEWIAFDLCADIYVYLMMNFDNFDDGKKFFQLGASSFIRTNTISISGPLILC